MLSQTVEYALRAMVFLAGAPEASRTLDQVADATKVPTAYLSKVMQQLAREGLVVSRRGVGGGFALAHNAASTTVLEVVQAVDPIRRITSCPLGLAAHGTRLCPLHKRLDDALATEQQAFGGTTLADILAEPTKSAPLCAFPKGAGTARRR